MELTISQELLQGALQHPAKACSTRAVNPILQHVKVDVTEDTITISGSDGDMGIRRRIAIADGKPDTLLAPGKFLYDLVSKLPNQDINLKTAGDTPQLTVTCRKSNYQVPVLKPDNFPETEIPEDVATVDFNAAELAAALQMVNFCAVKESTTGSVHYTNGTFLDFTGEQLAIVATDGHRLALHYLEGVATEGEMSILAPVKLMDIVASMLPDDTEATVQLLTRSNQLFFKWSSYLVSSGLFDVKFPPYARVIPKGFNTKVYMPRKELIDALARIILISKKRDANPVAVLKAEDNVVKITAQGGEEGSGAEEFGGDGIEGVEVSGSAITMSFNPMYLTDCLKQLAGDQVILNFVDEQKPLTVTCTRHPNYTYIMMPIRMD